jgi:single stranded DNA-binding protein
MFVAASGPKLAPDVCFAQSIARDIGTNLGKDPDVRRLNSGDQVVSFSVAASETWRDKASGEHKERTEWHNVAIFNENLGKVAEQYCKKGTATSIRERALD